MTRHTAPTLNYAVAALMVGLTAAASRASAQTPAPEALQSVVITAEKRLTTLDKTPEAVSAVSGLRLAEMGASGLQDVVGLVPNVSFSTAFGVAKINIRGVGYNYGDPGVATYVDGSYVSDLYSANTGLFDLQRVEVLRGPQGALYGRNATGGAVNFISALPTAKPQGQVTLLGGNYARKEAEGFVSGPLGDTGTRVRLSFQVKEHDGYTANSIAGQSFGPVIPGNPGSVAPGRVDDQKTRAVRLQTLTDLGRSGTLRLIASQHREDDVGALYALLPQPAQNSLYLFNVSPSGSRVVTSTNGQSTLVDATSLQAIYERQLGASTFTFTASHRKTRSVYFSDGDSTPALVSSTRLQGSSTDQSVDAHLASEEGRAFQWLVGATYLQVDARVDNEFDQKISLKMFNPVAPAVVAIPASQRLGGVGPTKSSAVYADARYVLAPAWALRAGVRLSRDEKEVREYQTNALTGDTKTATPSAGWTSTPGNLGLEWSVDKDTLAYGKVSHGFKSGAINVGLLQPKAVEPETVTSVEIGAKTTFLGKRGALSMALFNSDYKNYQMFQFTALSAALVNAPKARISGLEAELLLRPVPSLTLGANLGLMDPTYREFSNLSSRNPAAGTQNLAGKQLINVSKAQASLSADWSQSWGGYTATVRGDYVWRDKFYFTEFNDADVMQPAYGVLNLAASIRPTGGAWKLYAQVRNATDATAYTNITVSGTPNAGHRAASYIPPRTVGLGVQIDF
jgi:iron complex outermembrane receptor protein